MAKEVMGRAVEAVSVALIVLRGKEMMFNIFTVNGVLVALSYPFITVTIKGKLIAAVLHQFNNMLLT